MSRPYYNNQTPLPSIAQQQQGNNYGLQLQQPLWRPDLYQSQPKTPSVPGLDTMTKDEMNKLLSDDAYFSEWFEGLESVKAMQTVQQELLENNRQLAEGNLAMEPQLKELKERHQALSQQLQSVKSRHQQLSEAERLLHQKNDVGVLRDRIDETVVQSEAESEQYAAAFLRGEMDHDAFIRLYRPARMLHHARQSKLDAMPQQ